MNKNTKFQKASEFDLHSYYFSTSFPKPAPTTGKKTCSEMIRIVPVPKPANPAEADPKDSNHRNRDWGHRITENHSAKNIPVPVRHHYYRRPVSYTHLRAH